MVGIFIGDNPEMIGGSQWIQPPYGLLDHGLLAVERKQLFGTLSTAERPEASTPPPRQNHRIKISLDPKI